MARGRHSYCECRPHYVYVDIRNLPSYGAYVNAATLTDHRYVVRMGTLNFYLDDELHQRAKSAAALNGLPLKAWCEVEIRKAVERFEAERRQAERSERERRDRP